MKPTKNACTALMFAILKGDEENVSMLIKAGSDINAADSNGETPLMQAVKIDHIFLSGVELLTGLEVM